LLAAAVSTDRSAFDQPASGGVGYSNCLNA
jgi:hypothetical protein